MKTFLKYTLLNTIILILLVLLFMQDTNNEQKEIMFGDCVHSCLEFKLNNLKNGILGVCEEAASIGTLETIDEIMMCNVQDCKNTCREKLGY